MTSSDSLAEDEVVPDRSIGYTKMGETHEHPNWSPNADSLPPRATSAGGGYSTVEDLLRFANALAAHKLLNEHYTELLTTGKVDTPGGGMKYAYGFGDRTVDGVRSFGHSGGAPGENCAPQILPHSPRVVAVVFPPQ